MAESKEDQEETQDDTAARRKARHTTRVRAHATDAGDGVEAKESVERLGEDPEEGQGEESSESEEPEAKPNRHERRRRKKLGEGEEEPKDRNARIRSKYKAKAKKEDTEDEALTPLSTSEIIDDALARGAARLGKWVRNHATALQYVVLVLILGGVGYGVYSWQTTNKAEQASSELLQAINADRARIESVTPKSTPASEEEEIFQTFKSTAERNAAALTSYRKAREARPDSGTALLARLGEAGVLLDQRSFDEALAAYREVKASSLAAADPDVRGRCIEGIGFALEGKGDMEAALQAYKELDTITGIKLYKELGMYHRARLLAAKGEKDQALKLIKEARERLQTTGEARHASYLIGVLEDLQRKLDPSSLPKRSIGGPGGPTSLEDLQKLQQQVLQEVERLQNKTGSHQDSH
ncbi:MAG: tetratricopeptide repeat protein [Myxococcales bacterium]|nr:tetratricopeptide repeat protein [Polyangiaceae bacterium]MDW8251199.1 tetratricopeptide repeat protein [Myxococcales bacterium]